MTSQTVRIGTRRSPLAMYQSELVADRIRETHPGVEIEFVHITTRGDRDTRQLSDIRDRGMFAIELQRALIDDEIDCAVHSSKDVPFDDGHPELQLVAWMPREDPRDALCMSAQSMVSLPQHARISTGAARRMSALKTIRPDIESVPIRGNVMTRLELSAERGDDACMLALAGLTRLGLLDRVGVIFDVSEVVPDAGQGAIVVEATVAPHAGRPVIDWSLLDDRPTAHACRIERGVAQRLGGGCEHPIGVHVTVAGEAYVFVAPAPGEPGMIASTYLPVEMDDASTLGAAAPTTDESCTELEQRCVDHIVGAARDQFPVNFLPPSTS